MKRLLGVAILLVLVAVAIKGAVAPPVPSTNAVVAAATSRVVTAPTAASLVTSAPVSQLIGRQVVLAGNPLVLSRTKEDFDHMLQAVGKHDDYGVKAMLASGQVFSVQTGTNALVLDNDYSYDYELAQVRVLSGQQAGRLGWIESTSLSY